METINIILNFFAVLFAVISAGVAFGALVSGQFGFFLFFAIFAVFIFFCQFK